MEVETKILRFEGTPGKTENQYVMSVPVPGKLDLLGMIEKPPFHIFSKYDTTYSTGVLAYVPHSMKLRISRDYQEPFVGVYIKITTKPDEIIDVTEVKGTFTISPTSHSHSGSASSLSLSRSPSHSSGSPPSRSPSTTSYLEERVHSLHNGVHNPNDGKDRVFSFSFFKNSVSKLPELESYEYYESRCHWPDVASQMDLFVKVVKTTYSVLVNEESCLNAPLLEEPKSTVSAAPYFLSDTYSDVTIKVGEVTFPAHKIILSERSKFFSRMFANSMRESKEGLVRIPDDDESLFREILRFMYEGKVEKLEENVTDLYILSDKYDIPDLTSLIEKYLVDHLNVDNAMEMFDLSQTVTTSQGLLAKKSKELIMWNKDKFASDLQSFKDFSRKYPEVIFELLQLQ